MVKQAVVLAGGIGSRLRPFTDTAPKPMYPINGKPFIHYLMEQIADFGIKEVIVLLGYLPDIIKEYLGDGSQYGIAIRYDETPVEWETGLRIKNIREKLNEVFLLMYCDNYCPVNFNKLCEDFEQNDADIQLSVYRNVDNYTKNNLKIEEYGRVGLYDKKRISPDLLGVDIGYALIKKKVLEDLDDGNVNFEASVYPKVTDRKKMYATITNHRYYSIGSYERIELTEQFFSKQKTVFIDRDGTINKRPPKACYIVKPEEFEWLPNAIKGIKLLNDKDYRIIMVSNQSGIARGQMTEKDLSAIHQKMEKDLTDAGAHIDKIYYCPHGWDEGCECRKPKPGMFYMAQKDFSLNLTECTMIGDDDRDMEAGQAAGCKVFKVTEERDFYSVVRDELV